MEAEQQQKISKYFSQQLRDFLNEKEYIKAIALLSDYFPKDGPTAVQKAKLYIKLGDLEEALAELEPFLSTYKPALFCKGEIIEKNKDYIQAWKIFHSCFGSECEGQALFSIGQLLEKLDFQINEEIIDNCLSHLDHFIIQNEKLVYENDSSKTNPNSNLNPINPNNLQFKTSNQEDIQNITQTPRSDTNTSYSNSNIQTSNINTARSMKSINSIDESSRNLGKQSIRFKDDLLFEKADSTAVSYYNIPSGRKDNQQKTIGKKSFISNPLNSNSGLFANLSSHMKHILLSKNSILERVIACYTLGYDKHQHIQCAYKIGCLYQNGTVKKLSDGSFSIGNPQDEFDVIAVDWFNKAANMQLPEALFMLGTMWESGRGTERKSLSKAAEYYEKAARLGNEAGMFHTGLGYWKGYGVRINIDRALKFLSQAKEHKAAITTKGMIYLEKKDYLSALEAFREAANLGSSKAMYNMAKMYLQGTPFTPQNAQKAKLLLRDAAHMGNHHALCDLGCFALEEGNCIEALRLFIEAKDKGSHWAILNIAKMYHTENSGLKMNVKTALSYYKEALKYQETEKIAEEYIRSLEKP